MLILVTGASGQLGQAIQAISQDYNDIEFYFATSSEADVTQHESLRILFDKLRPNFCINAAAYTAVDLAESDVEKAFEINRDGAANIAKTCDNFDVVLLHISTDFVFDGQKKTPYLETDAVNPLNVYGNSKKQGEEAVMQCCKKYFIIRTSWLFSVFGHNFMNTIIRLASEKTSIKVVNDQFGTPTHAIDLANAIIGIIASGKQDFGIYNFSNEGKASWYEFACEIKSVKNLALEVSPISQNSYPMPAARPEYSVLDKTKIKKVFNIEIRDWKEALKTYEKCGLDNPDLGGAACQAVSN